jgi:hypothetical protein
VKTWRDAVGVASTLTRHHTHSNVFGSLRASFFRAWKMTELNCLHSLHFENTALFENNKSNYLKIGFSWNGDEEDPWSQCVICCGVPTREREHTTEQIASAYLDEASGFEKQANRIF